jgi:hypothetical protein
VTCDDVNLSGFVISFQLLSMSLQTLERRMAALEARLADVEGGHGETIYKLHWTTTKINLDLAKILNHLGLEPTAAADVDATLDED